jgi:imidazolonepropionase-like amidohydrolase
MAVTALLSALVGSSSVSRATPHADADSVILIQNATILTVSHGIIENGSILIKDGKIAEVGSSIKAPTGARVIDAAGQFVMPGIIDCHSHIAIEGGVNEGSVSVSSIANIAEVLDSDDVGIYRDLAGGVTTANILHGSANSIGGQTIVIKLRWGQPRQRNCCSRAHPGIKFALGENPKRSEFQHSRAAQTLSGHAYGRRRKTISGARLQKREIIRSPGGGRGDASLAEKKMRCRRDATCDLNRWSKSWTESATCTRTAIAKTKS